MKKKTIGIILVRLDSERLPGKALKSVNGYPLISYCIRRAIKIIGIDKIVIATSERNVDNPLEKIASDFGIGIYRGSFKDVAGRCIECCKKENADFFVRLNGDSPFVDVELISTGIGMIENSTYDMVTNLLPRSYPYGISVEVIRTQSFKEIYTTLLESSDHEHVTSYIYRNMEKYNIGKLPVCFPDLSHIHVTVDTKHDLELFKKSVSVLGSQIYTAKYYQIASIYTSILKENYDNTL